LSPNCSPRAQRRANDPGPRRDAPARSAAGRNSRFSSTSDAQGNEQDWVLRHKRSREFSGTDEITDLREGTGIAGPSLTQGDAHEYRVACRVFMPMAAELDVGEARFPKCMDRFLAEVGVAEGSAAGSVTYRHTRDDLMSHRPRNRKQREETGERVAPPVNTSWRSRSTAASKTFRGCARPRSGGRARPLYTYFLEENLERTSQIISTAFRHPMSAAEPATPSTVTSKLTIAIAMPNISSVKSARCLVGSSGRIRRPSSSSSPSRSIVASKEATTLLMRPVPGCFLSMIVTPFLDYVSSSRPSAAPTKETTISQARCLVPLEEGLARCFEENHSQTKASNHKRPACHPLHPCNPRRPARRPLHLWQAHVVPGLNSKPKFLRCQGNRAVMLFRAHVVMVGLGPPGGERRGDCLGRALDRAGWFVRKMSRSRRQIALVVLRFN
jgi:hypothetical protein